MSVSVVIAYIIALWANRETVSLGGLSRLRSRESVVKRSHAPTVQTDCLEGDLRVTSQEELLELLSHAHVLNGNIPVFLPAGGSFEVITGAPRLIVKRGNPRITVKEDSSPVIEAKGSSSPFMISQDSSEPSMYAWGGSKPRMVARDSSAPVIDTHNTSKAKIRISHGSKPVIKSHGRHKPTEERI